jgi:hypothetical protein
MSADGALDIDWYEASRDSVIAALGMVPEVGELLAALTDILWPTGEDVWSEIKQRVEALIQQHLDDYAYKDVQAALSGLQSVVNQYVTALSIPTSSPAYLLTLWVAAYTQFLQFRKKFQLPGFELLLLPLFAQFVNLQLSLLRDVVQKGSAWGLSPEVLQQRTGELTRCIADSVSYAAAIDKAGLDALTSQTGRDDHHCQPFRTLNHYNREMTLIVRDHATLWPYFDLTQYPQPVPVTLTREVYSEPFGTCDASGPINLPTPPATKICGMSICGGDRVDSIQVGFADGSKVQMGGPHGSVLPPRGGRFQVDPDDPIVSIQTVCGDALSGIRFTFQSGKSTRMFGGQVGGQWGGYTLDQHFLSSLYVAGTSPFYNQCIACIVFGFRLLTPKSATGPAYQRLFAASPAAPSLAAFSQRLPAAGQPEIEHNLIPETWNAERTRFHRKLAAFNANANANPPGPRPSADPHP